MRRARSLVCLVLATGCAGQDVVVFDLRDAGAAGAAGAGASELPLTCQSNTDCPDGWACEKSSCSATTGACLAHPVCFDSTPALVCGCDGVTYWNDCLRQQIGPAASMPGQCGSSARVCHDASDCGTTGFACGHLFLPADMCGFGMGGPHGPGPDPGGGPGPPGTCWAIPNTCDASLDPLRWTECGASAPAGCTDTCTALRSGSFYVSSSSGSCP